MRAELRARHAPRSGRALFGSSVASLLGLLGILVPKCPLCLAAYLCVFGVSASTARSVAWLGLPLCLGLIGVSVIATALFVVRRSSAFAPRKAPPCARCPKSGEVSG